MSVEWGVQHSQGIRPCTSEKTAREDLGMLTRSWERSSLKNRESARPFIVSRTVTPWLPAD